MSAKALDLPLQQRLKHCIRQQAASHNSRYAMVREGVDPVATSVSSVPKSSRTSPLLRVLCDFYGEFYQAEVAACGAHE